MKRHLFSKIIRYLTYTVRGGNWITSFYTDNAHGKYQNLGDFPSGQLNTLTRRSNRIYSTKWTMNVR